MNGYIPLNIFIINYYYVGYRHRHAPIIVKINSSRYSTILYSTGPFIPSTKPNQLRLYISKGQPAILKETQKHKTMGYSTIQSTSTRKRKDREWSMCCLVLHRLYHTTRPALYTIYLYILIIIYIYFVIFNYKLFHKYQIPYLGNL